VGGLIYRSDHVQLDRLEDLRGKTVITSPSSTYTDSLKNLLSSTGIDESDIDWQFVDHPSGKVALFRGNPEAIAIGGLDRELVEYQDAFGDTVLGASFEDFGYEMYGQTIIVQASYFREAPEEVCGFVRATLRGLQDTIDDPQAALDALAEAQPDLVDRLKEPAALKALNNKLALVGDTQALRLGLFDDESMENIVAYLSEVDGFEPLPLTDYYSNDCVESK
jgi:NitT/TauT family transport system substrate-binding protein